MLKIAALLALAAGAVAIGTVPSAFGMGLAIMGVIGGSIAWYKPVAAAIAMLVVAALGVALGAVWILPGSLFVIAAALAVIGRRRVLPLAPQG